VTVGFRPARASDSEAIAALHADSWRRHYRGAYSDAFLDGDVAGAQAFYQALGGSFAGREQAQPPGGIADRLNGSPIKLRIAWPDPSVILAG